MRHFESNRLFGCIPESSLVARAEGVKKPLVGAID